VADPQDDVAASRVGYVGLAITEIATLRAQLGGPRPADSAPTNSRDAVSY
jgi:hypothetical protein